MSKNQCFKIVRGTNYDKAVKEHFNLTPKWSNVMKSLSELLGENIEQMALTTDNVFIELDDLVNEDNKKLFKTSGELKTNTNKGKQLLEQYKQIVKEEGLSDFKELRLINFIYGIMRTQGQSLESFRTSEDDIYYKADFDLVKKSNGLVEPISEIEYEEKYLNELKITQALQALNSK
jgi:hypothetical protein